LVFDFLATAASVKQMYIAPYVPMINAAVVPDMLVGTRSAFLLGIGGAEMLLLSAIGGFLFGAWLTHQWGNHRAKYYKNQMRKALILASKTQEANKIVALELEKVKEGNRAVSVNTMRAGVLDAISDLAREGV
jgi:hypothetical protein